MNFSFKFLTLPKRLREEEVVNACTHASSFGSFIVAALFLTFKTMSPWVSALYVVPIAFTLLSSVLYHGWIEEEGKKFFRTVDQLSIHFMIAASWTPFLWMSDQQGLAVAIWILALVAAAFRLVTKEKITRMATVPYVLLASIGLFGVIGIVTTFSTLVSILFVLNLASYLVGTYYYELDETPWYHSVWHLYVNAGVYFNFLACYLILT